MQHSFFGPAVRNVARGIERKKVKVYMDQDKWDASNRTAANVILADPVRYDGALLQWARAFTERVK